MSAIQEANTAALAPLDRLAALRRIALAVVRRGTSSERELLHELLAELVEALPAAGALVSVFADEGRTTLQTLAVRLDGTALPDFAYPVRGSPCQRVIGAQFRYAPRGVLNEVDPDSPFSLQGLDAYAAFPLNDSRGVPMGVLAAVDRLPIAHGDADHAEVVLKVVAGRLEGDLERRQSMNVLRDAALAVSAAQGETVFNELARMLAATLQVEFAFIARYEADDPENLNMVALHSDGRVMGGLSYPIAPTPCRTVLGQQFRAYPRDLAALFPDDPDVLDKGAESYAGLPLTGINGAPIGVIAVGSRRPLADAGRAESVLKVFAARAAAEIERLRALEALRRSEASYRTIFDSAESAIYVHDWDDFHLVDVNRRACVEHGRTREELLGISPRELMAGDPPYDMEHAVERLRAARLGRCPPFEWQVRLGSGELRWWDIHLKAAQIDGRPCVLAFTYDVTERRSAAQQLRASEEQYRAIFNASADALMLWDRRLQRVDVNPAHQRIFGFSRDEVVGRGFEGLPYPEELARPRIEMVRRALAGEPSVAELEALHKDGRRIVTELRAIPFQHRGEPHVLQIARDVTEQRKADMRLRDSEEQYRAIFDASSDALILWDSRLRRVDVNPAFERIFGWSRRYVVGFDLETCPDSGGASAERRAMLQRALEGQPGSAEMELLHRDGRRIVAEIHTVPIQYRDEPHVLLIVREVTERRELEAQLRQAQKMEAIGQLTGGIAHDFNNILTSVLGYVAMAEERAATGSDARLLRQLGQARLSAERARDLVAQMLAFARRTGGSRQTESPARLVQDALELLRPTLPSSLLLEVDDLQTPVPDIEADAVQLGQVLMNLVINARDAVDGAGRVRIGLLERDVAPGEPGLRCQSCGHMLPMGRWVEFSVADDGCGITSDTLTRMFMPFFTTKPAGRGSGMGLAMVHGIVHDHRGHVLVDTATDRGAVFRVLLPAVDAAPLTAAGTAGSGAAPAQAVTASLPTPALRGRVLVVDDDALAGEFLRERLEDWGLSVGLAQDPRDALASIAQSPQAIDVLVTDLTMPHLSGLQLALQATRLRADLPVLLISGDLSAVEPARQREFGVAATLSKPLDPVALFAALRQLLG